LPPCSASAAERNATAALRTLGMLPTFGRDGRPVVVTDPALLA
jgi:hypothetical protein